jgi:hypothetical protein
VAVPNRRVSLVLAAVAIVVVALLLGMTGAKAWHGWDWRFWNPLVAIGTILLALATGALAWFTYQVTQDSRDEIRLERRRLDAAQRPVVLPAEIEYTPAEIGDSRSAITFMNAGPGVALNIECKLHWGSPSGLIATLPRFHMRPAGSKKLPVDISNNVDWSHVKGRVRCEDIAGMQWVTDFEVHQDDWATPPTIVVTPPTLVG